MKRYPIGSLLLRGLLTLSLSTVSVGFAGQSTGNGGDTLRPESGSAWFLGDAPVKYCVVSKGLPSLRPAVISDSFVRAYETWVRYVSVKRPSQTTPYGFFFSKTLSALESCNGTEDLTIYYGEQNEEVRKYASQHTNPIAFAVRTSYDMNSGRGKGFIWIAPAGALVSSERFPDWERPGQLDGVLLHEVGHVFGCDHVEGTIMAADLIGSLRTQRDRYVDRLRSIDQERELFFALDETFSYTGEIDDEASYYNNQAKTFEYFMKRPLVGNPRAEFISPHWDSVPTPQEPQGWRKIVLEDEVGKGEFWLKFDVADALKTDGEGYILKRAFSGAIGPHELEFEAERNRSYVLFGQAMLQDGTRVLVRLEHNVTGSLASFGRPVVVRFLNQENKWTKLFVLRSFMGQPLARY